MTFLEDADEFDKLRKRFFKDWQPEGATERAEVLILAQTHWHLQRGQHITKELLDYEICDSLADSLRRSVRTAADQLENFARPPGRKLNDQESEECRKVQQNYVNLMSREQTVRRIVRSNVRTVGAALSRLGPKDQKLATALRYMAHFERTAERTVRNLLLLKTQRGVRK